MVDKPLGDIVVTPPVFFCTVQGVKPVALNAGFRLTSKNVTFTSAGRKKRPNPFCYGEHVQPQCAI